MINYDNPFRQFRAEQMGQELWKYYVPGPFQKQLTPRPLVLEGGRGSGKTMFFLCNSWREMLLRLEAYDRSFTDLLTPPEFIGIYYKVDTAFVTAMHRKGRDDWDGIFSTYLGTCIIKDLLFLLKHAKDKSLISESELEDVFALVSNIFLQERILNNLDSALEACENIFDEIEMVINSPSYAIKIKGTLIGRIIQRFIRLLRDKALFNHTVFRIFIDEYETLLEPQQKLVNTLIKHSDSVLIYNIGMRPKGMLTHSTSGGQETIQQPHDYHLFRPETALNPEDVSSKSEYYDLLKQICRLRFKRFCALRGLKDSDIPVDIEYYLDRYNIDNEINDIVSSKQTPPFLRRLKDLILKMESDEAKAKQYIEILVENAPPFNARLHLCLLLRADHYRPTLESLAKEYSDSLESKSSVYNDWVNNTKLGITFLLAREYRRQKKYYGFDVFAMLSSGAIRYFLELCEQAFDFAMLGNFSWDNPRPISPNEQTRAARYVSRYKIREIESYEPYGRSLRILVQHLGEVFREFHRNPNLTLGEPEPNHFSTNDFSLSDSAKKILNSAIMWAVLQERLATKEKETELPIETSDYHLNHIYAPYFEISYRKKRKLVLNHEQLEAFLLGNEEAAKRAALEIVNKRIRLKDSKDVESHQLILFEEELEND